MKMIFQDGKFNEMTRQEILSISKIIFYRITDSVQRIYEERVF